MHRSPPPAMDPEAGDGAPNWDTVSEVDVRDYSSGSSSSSSGGGGGDSVSGDDGDCCDSKRRKKRPRVELPMGFLSPLPPEAPESRAPPQLPPPLSGGVVETTRMSVPEIAPIKAEAVSLEERTVGMPLRAADQGLIVRSQRYRLDATSHLTQQNAGPSLLVPRLPELPPLYIGTCAAHQCSSNAPLPNTSIHPASSILSPPHLSQLSTTSQVDVPDSSKGIRPRPQDLTHNEGDTQVDRGGPLHTNGNIFAVAHQDRLMNPGPLDRSLLTEQDTHRSEAVWAGQDTPSLVCRRREASFRRQTSDSRIVPYLQQAGFYGISQIPFMQLDWNLVTALVERWRPETNTFHLPHGEVSPTLQDISIQLGLPVDGDAVTGSLNLNWADECERLLGVRPDAHSLKGGNLRMSWLQRTFNELPTCADDNTTMHYARAYILQLLGGVLFADKSSGFVHLMFLPLLEDFRAAGGYSWGAACLAWLYRQLGIAAKATAQTIGGALSFLQVWAWDRFPHIAPISRHLREPRTWPLAGRWDSDVDVKQLPLHVVGPYRDALDRQTPEQIVWMPYNDIIDSLPTNCREGSDIWLARVPLICFNIVEWHLPDRVVRQFGGIQRIPIPCDNFSHGRIDLRGRPNEDWVKRQWAWICMWQDRRASIVQLEHGGTMPDGVDCDYHAWYRSVTRRYIGRNGAMFGAVADAFDWITSCNTLQDAHEIAAAGRHLLRGHGGVTLFPPDQTGKK